MKYSKSFIKNIDILSKNNSINLRSEPIYSVFMSSNIMCVVIRTRLLHYCGYVEINKQLGIMSDMDYNHGIFNNIDVHGGITYLGSLFMEDKRIDGKIFVGFDTGHCYDLLIPTHHLTSIIGTNSSYKSFRWTVKETIKLSKQIYRLQRSLNLNNEDIK